MSRAYRLENKPAQLACPAHLIETAYGPASASFHAAGKRTRWGAATRQICGAATRRGPCRQPLLQGMTRCLGHAGPVGAQEYRSRQLAAFLAGDVPGEVWREAEARRERTRISNRRRYARGWLLPGLTIRFNPVLEGEFQDAVGRHLVRPWAEMPDGHRDRLRWAWRRYHLDRDLPDAWAAKAGAVMADLRARPAYEPAIVEHDDGLADYVILVERRAYGSSKRSKIDPSEIARITSPAAIANAARAASKPIGSRGRPRGSGSALGAASPRAKIDPTEQAALRQSLNIRHRQLLAELARDNTGFVLAEALTALAGAANGDDPEGWIKFLQTLRHGSRRAHR